MNIEEVKKIDILFIAPIPLIWVGVLSIYFISKIFGFTIIGLAIIVIFYSLKCQGEMRKFIEDTGGIQLRTRVGFMNQITLGTYIYIFYFKYYRKFLLNKISIEEIKNKLTKLPGFF